MKKKSLVLCILLALVLLVGQVPFAQAAGDISVIVNGKTLAADPAPFIQSDRLLIPFRAIFEALGANVTWDESSQTVTGVKGDTSVILVIGQSTATIGQETDNLDVPAQIVNGHTVVPLRFVSEALGAQVNWEGAQRQVIINGSVTSQGGNLPATLSGNLLIDGSTSVQPLAEQIKAAFVAKYPQVSINIAGGGSGVGVADAAAGKVNIGASSTALKPTDPKSLVGTVIAKDAIVIIVNPSNPIAKLTKQDVQNIYSGNITNWMYLTGQSQPIMVYSRTAPSGTFDYFKSSFMGSTNLVSTAKQLDSNGLIRQAVASNPNAIGFISMGYRDNTVKAPLMDGVVPNLDNAKGGKYPYVRPFVLCTKGDPTGLAKDFIQFCLSPEGQAIVAKEYIAL